MAAEKELVDSIRKLIEPVLEAEGYDLVLVECLRMKTRWIVRLYIDKDGGVDIEDCSNVSGLAGDILDVHDVPPGPYTLEVSSPGLDRPLSRDKDFLAYRGQRIMVKTDVKLEGSRNFRGVLEDYREENGETVLLLSVGDRTLRIPRGAVVKANLDYDFSTLK